MTSLRILVGIAALVLWSHIYAHASSAIPRESILPPGMRTLTIVDLKRNPDVRCVVPNCFAPPQGVRVTRIPHHKARSQRRFERRLLSPGGPAGRLE